MTIEEFLVKLAETKKTKIRSSQQSYLRYQASPYGQHCPITVVASNMFNHRYGLTEYKTAGAALGLSEDDISTIIVAADIPITPRALKLRQAMEDI